MSHVVTVSDLVWNYAKRQSGLSNPASWIRETWIMPAMFAEISSDIPEDLPKDRWAEVGCEISNMDPEFTQARGAYIASSGGEEEALKFLIELQRRGFRSPRAWVMNWWKKQKPAEAG